MIKVPESKTHQSNQTSQGRALLKIHFLAADVHKRSTTFLSALWKEMPSRHRLASFQPKIRKLTSDLGISVVDDGTAAMLVFSIRSYVETVDPTVTERPVVAAQTEIPHAEHNTRPCTDSYINLAWEGSQRLLNTPCLRKSGSDS